MSCKDCEENKIPCSECNDPGLTTSAPCGEGVDCEGDECTETFDIQCMVWTGQDLICGSTVIATKGDRMNLIMERMIALFCGPQNPAQDGITLLTPDPDTTIMTPDDVIVCVDRNNCFEDLVMQVEEGGPAGILFSWDEIDGTPHVDEPTVVIENGRSCILFQINTTALQTGQYSFNFEITGCGDTILVPVFFSIP